MVKDCFLLCYDCGEIFKFSTTERQYYKQKGYHEPCHCRNCRNQRRTATTLLSRRMKRKGWQ